MSSTTALHVLVAVVMCVAIWFAIGFVPEPKARTGAGEASRSFPIRWILYVLDIVWLVWYLSRYL